MDVYANYSLKSWDELTFTDDYMFKLVMSKHPKFIKKLLEIILQVKVRDIRFHETEKNLKESYDGHGIRFDLYVEDSDNTIYDIEMQVGYYSSNALAKRMRFYQGIFDVDSLKAGQSYTLLKKSIIIFLCPFKFLNGERSLYTFNSYCLQDKSLLLPDETTKIIVSSAGNRTPDTPKALIPILDYMNGKSASSNFTKAIDEAIKKEKDIETERMSYMTYEMKLQEMQDFGYNKGKTDGKIEGKIEGRAELITNMLKNQMKPEQIAKIANMTVEQIISIGKKAAVL